VIGLAAFLLLTLGLGWAALVASTAWMLTHPPRRTYASAVSRGRPGDPAELSPPRGFERWSITRNGITLPVWDVPGDLPAGGPTIILSHGWADSRIGGLVRAPALVPFASRLILYDGRGHGEAGGTCRLGTEETADLLDLIDRIADGSPLVLYGWSLGAGVSLAVASGNHRIAAVIAESPYRVPATPARNVLTLRGLPYRCVLAPALTALRVLNPGLAPRRFDRAAAASRIECPVLVLHGEDDEICPVADGRAVAAAAPNSRLAVIPGGGHNDLWTDPRLAALSAERLAAFLAAIPAASAT
jgi:pimeloyl-ACP methyl ester carboxylesterase